MNVRYRIPDPRLRPAREKLGWTQSRLAAVAGLSLRAIQNIEHGHPAENSNLSILEHILGVQPNNRALSSLCNSISREKSDLLRTKTAESLPRQVEPYYDFMRSVQRDAEGNSMGALRLCNLVLEEDDSSDQALTCAVLIHLATVYDHLKLPAEALAASKRALVAAKDLPEKPHLWWWSSYQKAIALGQLNKLSDAITVLRELLEITSESHRKGQQSAALHQLGVIKLHLGRLAEAAELFQQCIELRGKNDHDFRLAYEYRRLGETYAKQDDRKRSRDFFHKALLVANQHNVGRYVKEIRLAAEMSGIPIL